jgi:hypothetical protein
MKTFIAAAAAVVLFANTSAQAATAIIGQPVPDFSATDVAGKTVKLSDYKGKIVVLEWTSKECPFVHKWYDGGAMQGLQKKAADDGVVWLSVDSSAQGHAGYMDAKAAADWIKTTKTVSADFLIDAKGDVGHLFDARTTPDMYVIDKDGKLAYAGAIDSIATTDPADIAKAKNYVTQALTELAAGKPVSVSSTKSYGCGVKY